MQGRQHRVSGDPHGVHQTVEVQGSPLVELVPESLLESRIDRFLHLGARVQGHQGVEPLDVGEVAAARSAFDDPGPLEEVEAGADGHVVDLAGKLLGDRLVSRDELVGALLAKHAVDALDDVQAGAGSLDEELLKIAVGGTEHEDAVRRFAVSPSTARFLVIGLDGAGQVVMQHQAHVRLVDAHAEGVGGHHDPGPARHERVLRPVSRGVIHAGVVGSGGNPLGGQVFGDGFDGFSGGRVDDAGPLHVCDNLAHLGELGGFAARRADHVAQVRPVEAGDEDRRVLEAQLLDDVLADFRSGGRGGREHRGPPQEGEGIPEAQVVGPEVVAPLGETVRLVDGQARNRHPLERGDERAVAEALGGDVDELVGSSRQLGQPMLGLVRIERGVDEGRGNSSLDEAVHLILHQGDERADHQGRAVQHHRRQLIADRLALPGGHDGHGLFAVEDRLNDLTLTLSKGRVAEIALQRVFKHGGERGEARVT
ncbi:hypothetical protein D3C87_1034630 [compost metagenome]